MTRPCKSNPGTTLHACLKKSSTKTLCGVAVVEVDVLAGYVWVCPKCFPEGLGSEDGEQIGGRVPPQNEGSEEGEPIGNRQ
jgi:hypothetical protein